MRQQSSAPQVVGGNEVGVGEVALVPLWPWPMHARGQEVVPSSGTHPCIGLGKAPL